MYDFEYDNKCSYKALVTIQRCSECNAPLPGVFIPSG